jgi:hypothetical protein
LWRIFKGAGYRPEGGHEDRLEGAGYEDRVKVKKINVQNFQVAVEDSRFKNPGFEIGRISTISSAIMDIDSLVRMFKWIWMI